MATIYVNQFGVVSEVIDHNILQPEVIEAIAHTLPQPIYEEIISINRPAQPMIFASAIKK